MDTRQEYRPDIDGLRAIAIASVVLYHADSRLVPAGYLGVDVFFVISGFLITRMLLSSDMRDLPAFFERRARRLLPALFAVLIVSTGLALWLLFPTELRAFDFHLRGALLFAANFTHADQLGYFGPEASSQPLLHTWSLAVEEQFYLIFPLFLLLCRKHLGAPALICVAGVFILSLALSLYFSTAWPETAFYMPHLRFWELCAGALLACGFLGRPTPRQAQVGALTGLSILLGSVFLTPATSAMPTPGAILPVLGTALLIWSCSMPNAVGKILACKPMVGLGLISYGLYLWHWPLLVFARIWKGGNLSPQETAAVVLTSILLAILSLVLIESPVRKRRRLSSPRGLGATLGTTAAVLIAISLAGDWSKGLPGRFDDTTARIMMARESWKAGPGILCARAGQKRRARDPGLGPGDLACPLGAQGPATFVVIGDSHAASLFPVIDEAAKSAGEAGLIMSTPACWPQLPGAGQGSACAAFGKELFGWLNEVNPRKIIVAVAWGKPPSTLNPGRVDTEIDGMRSLLAALLAQGFEVTIFTQVPWLDFKLPEATTAAIRRGLDLPSGPALSALSEEIAHEENILASVRDHGSVQIIDLRAQLCPNDQCRVFTEEGRPVYADDNHLTPDGALSLRPQVSRAFAAE